MCVPVPLYPLLVPSLPSSTLPYPFRAGNGLTPLACPPQAINSHCQHCQVKSAVATQAAVIHQATTSMSRAAPSLMSRTQVLASSRQPSYATHSHLKAVKVHRTRRHPHESAASTPQAPMLPIWCLQPSTFESLLPTHIVITPNIDIFVYL